MRVPDAQHLPRDAGSLPIVHDDQRSRAHRGQAFAHRRRQQRTGAGRRRSAPGRAGRPGRSSSGASCRCRPARDSDFVPLRTAAFAPAVSSEVRQSIIAAAVLLEGDQQVGRVVRAAARPGRVARVDARGRRRPHRPRVRGWRRRARARSRRNARASAAYLRASISQKVTRRTMRSGSASRTPATKPRNCCSAAIATGTPDPRRTAPSRNPRRASGRRCARRWPPRSAWASVPKSSKSPRPANRTISAGNVPRAAGRANTCPSCPPNMRRSVKSRIAPPRATSSAAAGPDGSTLRKMPSTMARALACAMLRAIQAQLEHAARRGSGHRLPSRLERPAPAPRARRPRGIQATRPARAGVVAHRATGAATPPCVVRPAAGRLAERAARSAAEPGSRSAAGGGWCRSAAGRRQRRSRGRCSAGRRVFRRRTRRAARRRRERQRHGRIALGQPACIRTPCPRSRRPITVSWRTPAMCRQRSSGGGHAACAVAALASSAGSGRKASAGHSCGVEEIGAAGQARVGQQLVQCRQRSKNDARQVLGTVAPIDRRQLAAPSGRRRATRAPARTTRGSVRRAGPRAG